MTLADLRCVRVAWIRGEPFVERAPVQRLVAVPVVLARRDHGLQGKARRLDSADGLAQRDEPLVVDAARQRPVTPVRLPDDDVAAGAHGRRQRSERARQVVPHECRAEAERGVPALGVERECMRIGFDDLDEVADAGGGHAFARRLHELGCTLDAEHRATEGRGEQHGRPALAAGEVEHAHSGVEPEVRAEELDLLGARRILDLVVALGDGVIPGHRGSVFLDAERQSADAPAPWAHEAGLLVEQRERARELGDFPGFSASKSEHEQRHFDLAAAVPAGGFRPRGPGVH